ncbi:MAG: hypothetical protein PX640_18105 [Microcystis sp. M49629_WE12]|nr:MULTISPECIES: hypothetical protein [unclassified Microcystis]MCE2661836.1 hypothetical protein [Microcystis sp. 53602_E8]MCZ8363142.1 hypothetical protein [Microcystis sp. LE19-251.1A]MDJ0565808.1 hypothetical protein [Microcystis sp. M49629_WE12]MCZ8025485.1 hypothetical protein [Microcystis sp. LE19-10.1B]MDJ0602877.1 hypothetical protein [Microcystis sp. M53602_WE12]
MTASKSVKPYTLHPTPYTPHPTPCPHQQTFSADSIYTSRGLRWIISQVT